MNALKTDRALYRATLWLLTALLAVLLGGALPAAAQEGTAGSVTVHVVQAGESVDAIAAQYGVSPAALRTANSFGTFEEAYVGQRLVIPPSARDRAAESVVAGLGDTLFSVAARHGVPLRSLGAVAGVANPANLVAGQSLLVPSSVGSEQGTLVRVEGALALWRLAVAHDFNLSALLLANNAANPAVAAAGGRLVYAPAEVEGAADLTAPWASMVLHPLPLEVGRTGGLTVQTRQPGTLTVMFMDKEWPVVSEVTMHQTLLAVDRWTTPGIYPLALTFTAENGETATYTRPIVIADGNYPPRETIRLAPDVFAKMEDAASVAGEDAFIDASMSGFNPERRWADGAFPLPAAGVMASAFGTLRAYNSDVFDRYHTGADLGGPTGTPIYAPADGIVVDAGLLDVRGYMTIIDHGWGVYTGYWHQSSILVEPGETVTRGQQIGTIGNTGLSTAAHLHWEMRINGVKVDPMQWVREAFP